MAFLGGVSNEAFIKKSLIFSITGMVFMAAFMALFLPDVDKDLDSELADLTAGYYDFTGAKPVSEEIWGLTGIYTPYGTDSEGKESASWGTTPDGWVYGSRVTYYEPSQMQGLSPDEGYAVAYDEKQGLYRYVKAGKNLDVSLGTAEDPSAGTLYTAAAMDIAHKSDVFFSPGSKQTDDRGTYYGFSGWRYTFQPLRDYKASDDLDVTRSTTSLSIVWYEYYGDSGLSGQLMLAGDQGVSYITKKEIVEAFSSASFSSKFQMKFNGLSINVYIKLNPYAIQFGGYTVEKCYDSGFWSVMVTSPSVTQDTSDFTLQAFSPDRAFDIIAHLLTFSMDGYGLSGVGATLCSLFFTVSLYTSLIAIGIEEKLVLILTGVLAVIQSISIL